MSGSAFTGPLGQASVQYRDIFKAKGSKHPEDTSSPERLPSLLVIQNYSRGGLDGIKLKEIRESFL